VKILTHPFMIWFSFFRTIDATEASPTKRARSGKCLQLTKLFICADMSMQVDLFCTVATICGGEITWDRRSLETENVYSVNEYLPIILPLNGWTQNELKRG